MTLYALVVAIDTYVPPVNALYGSRNDAAALVAHLRSRAGTELALEELYDADATRERIIERFRGHLGAASRGDVALFFYAGHGSEEPAPPAIAHLEPSAKIQTIVAHDSFRRVGDSLVRPIADKEVALLIAEVSSSGAHVAVVLDCCNSGHGTRGDDLGSVRAWVPDPQRIGGEWRSLAEELTVPRRADELLVGTIEHWAEPPAAHVAVAACRSDERAKELPMGGVVRGAFSRALVDTLDTLGPGATYRSVLETVRARVERSVREQSPQLYPSESGGLGDSVFLDGAVRPVPASFTMTKGTTGWSVDAGLVHGLRPPSGAEAYALSCEAPSGAHAGMVTVAAVDTATSTVVPDGWVPEDVAYRATIAAVPLPPVEVAFTDSTDSAETAETSPMAMWIASAIAGTAAQGARPSPHVRAVERDAADSGAPRLHVRLTSPDEATVCRRDGTPLAPPATVRSDDDAAAVVATLEHIARWEQVRGLCDHPSPLAGAVKIAVTPAQGPDAERSAAGAALASVGGYRLEYRRADDGGWHAPYVFIDVANLAEEELCVAVLDLTDRFRCHPVFLAERIAPGHTVALWSGAAIPVELPPGRAVAPSIKATDWLVVIASDVDFYADAFELPALGEPLVAASRSGADAATSTLERLARRAVTRDVGAAGPATPARWSASAVTLETVVPSA